MSNVPVLLGRLSGDALLDELAEYRERFEAYQPAPAELERLVQLVSDDVRVVVATGTWCSDARREVPRLLRLAHELAARGRGLHLEIIGFDREKQEPAPFVEAFSIDRVPTFIVLRGGREIGRVVERPTSRIEADLVAVLSRSFP